VRTNSGEQHIEGSDILVALGAFRTPPELDLRRPASNWTGATTFASMTGWRRVRQRCGRWGNARRSPQFTHISEDDFRIIRNNLAGGNRTTRDRLVPYCMFTDPPLAHVGLSEGEAERQGVIVRVAKLPMDAVLAHRRPIRGKAL